MYLNEFISRFILKTFVPFQGQNPSQNRVTVLRIVTFVIEVETRSE